MRASSDSLGWDRRSDGWSWNADNTTEGREWNVQDPARHTKLRSIVRSIRCMALFAQSPGHFASYKPRKFVAPPLRGAGFTTSLASIRGSRQPILGSSHQSCRIHGKAPPINLSVVRLRRGEETDFLRLYGTSDFTWIWLPPPHDKTRHIRVCTRLPKPLPHLNERYLS